MISLRQRADVVLAIAQVMPGLLLREQIPHMSTKITRNPTPEERELEKKKAELVALEADLIQRELDLATLRAELAEFEVRNLRFAECRNFYRYRSMIDSWCDGIG